MAEYQHFQLSDNGLKAITLIVGAVVSLGTLWLQQHNQHVERMEVETKKVEALQSIDKQLGERKPLVFGEKH